MSTVPAANCVAFLKIIEKFDVYKTTALLCTYAWLVMFSFILVSVLSARTWIPSLELHDWQCHYGGWHTKPGSSDFTCGLHTIYSPHNLKWFGTHLLPEIIMDPKFVWNGLTFILITWSLFKKIGLCSFQTSLLLAALMVRVVQLRYFSRMTNQKAASYQ